MRPMIAAASPRPRLPHAAGGDPEEHEPFGSAIRLEDLVGDASDRPIDVSLLQHCAHSHADSLLRLTGRASRLPFESAYQPGTSPPPAPGSSICGPWGRPRVEEDGAGSWPARARRRIPGLDHGTGHVGLHDVPRRGRRPTGARLPGRVDDAEVPSQRDRRSRRMAPRTRRLGAARRGRRAEACRRWHGRGLGPSQANPVGGWYGLRKGYRGRFGMYLPPLSKHSGSSNSRTTPATTACGRSEPAHP